MHRNDVAVPAAAGEPGAAQLTGVTCPDCSGAVRVVTEGRDVLVFVCRIGHAYAATELVMAKEQHLEALLWTAVSALEELSVALRDLGVDQDRQRAIAADAEELRRLLERTRPARIGEP